MQPLYIFSLCRLLHLAFILRACDLMTSEAQNQPLQVFIIYAREDERFRERLVKNMSLLKREGVISTWYDRMILPGQDWDNVITENLKASRIFLLLVGPDFLASEYIINKEMDHALKMHDAGLAVVIPIILRHCDWKETRLKGLQALPRAANQSPNGRTEIRHGQM